MRRDVHGRFAPTGRRSLTAAECSKRYRDRCRARRHDEAVHHAAVELRRFWKSGTNRPLLVQPFWLAA